MTVTQIVTEITKHFCTFGGADILTDDSNPIARAMKGKAPIFAAGVDIREVVDFVLSAREK